MLDVDQTTDDGCCGGGIGPIPYPGCDCPRAPTADRNQTVPDAGWRRGLPRGPVTQGTLDSYEVYFSPGGWKWHRKRTAEEKAAYIAWKIANER